MARSSYKPLVNYWYYRFANSYTVNNDVVVDLVKRVETERLRLYKVNRLRRKEGEKILRPTFGLRYAPRQLTVIPSMVGMVSKVKAGKGYFNVYFESSMVGLKVGSLTFTRFRSPISITSKNRFGDGLPNKGFQKLKMGQADKKARKVRKKRKK